jgi:small subunit ribosomal protein S3
LQSKYNGLLGFKIQFRGRFTRKQIAACYKYVNGKMPLTSIDANIDYAFRSVAIKNSAVGVKVWFYKGQKGTPFFCKVL